MEWQIKDAIKLGDWIKRKPHEAFDVLIIVVLGFSIYSLFKESKRNDHLENLLDNCRVESAAKEQETKEFIMSLIIKTNNVNEQKDSVAAVAKETLQKTKETIKKVKKKL